MEEKKTIGGRAYWVGHTRTYVLGALEARKTDANLENCLVGGMVTGLLTDKILLLK